MRCAVLTAGLVLYQVTAERVAQLADEVELKIQVKSERARGRWRGRWRGREKERERLGGSEGGRLHRYGALPGVGY
eukprot:1434405-Rhodomonas_salina.2